MFLIISWVITGLVVGSVGVAGVASAIAKDGPRGDPNLDAIFIWLFVTTVLGAVCGGVLARMVRRKFANDPRKTNLLAAAPLAAVALLMIYAMSKP